MRPAVPPNTNWGETMNDEQAIRDLFTGAHDYHSVREWISVQDMGAATATLIHLAQVWAEPGS